MLTWQCTAHVVSSNGDWSKSSPLKVPLWQGLSDYDEGDGQPSLDAVAPLPDGEHTAGEDQTLQQIQARRQAEERREQVRQASEQLRQLVNASTYLTSRQNNDMVTSMKKEVASFTKWRPGGVFSSDQIEPEPEPQPQRQEELGEGFN